MSVTPSQLRADIYRLLDRVLETGTPLEIERNGRTLLVIAAEAPGRLGGLPRREGYLACDAEDLVRVDWSVEWKP